MPLLLKIVWFERRACIQYTHLIEKYEKSTPTTLQVTLQCSSFFLDFYYCLVCLLRSLHLAYLLHYTEFGWYAMQPCVCAHGRPNERVNK